MERTEQTTHELESVRGQLGEELSEYPESFEQAVPGRMYADGCTLFDAWEPAEGQVQLDYACECRDGGIATELADCWNACGKTPLTLVEAAPDLLAALKSLLDEPISQKTYYIARVAVAKAEGGAS